MKKFTWMAIISCAALAIVPRASANTISTCSVTGITLSCTGTLDTPEDVFEEAFTLTAPSTEITLQTYGFGGGENAAGAIIPKGGFDSLVALFSGTGDAATILTDISGDPIGSQPGSTQFAFGCPPASEVNIGSGASKEAVCGDSRFSAALGPGTYTLLLSDADYVPYAFEYGPPVSSLLSDGYSDLTSGVFQTCDDNGDCITPNGNFAVDIRGVPEPEPSALALLGLGLAGVMLLWRRRTGRRAGIGTRAIACV